MKIARREATSSAAQATAGTYKTVMAVAMSVPRLGFMDNFFCVSQALQALSPMVVPLRKFTGAFWGQCLTRVLEVIVAEDDPEFIMTNDYDTIFKPSLPGDLLDILRRHPEIDAIAPIQMHRMEPRPLFSVKDAEGRFVQEVPDDYFAAEASRISTAHMGCMIFRAEALKKLKKPWFHSMPDLKGGWDGGHVDDDTWFWAQWEGAGNTPYLANRHIVGHAELLVRWPSEEFDFIDQHPGEFWTKGFPQGVWK